MPNIQQSTNWMQKGKTIFKLYDNLDELGHVYTKYIKSIQLWIQTEPFVHLNYAASLR